MFFIIFPCSASNNRGRYIFNSLNSIQIEIAGTNLSRLIFILKSDLLKVSIMIPDQLNIKR